MLVKLQTKYAAKQSMGSYYTLLHFAPLNVILLSRKTTSATNEVTDGNNRQIPNYLKIIYFRQLALYTVNMGNLGEKVSI